MLYFSKRNKEEDMLRASDNQSNQLLLELDYINRVDEKEDFLVTEDNKEAYNMLIEQSIDSWKSNSFLLLGEEGSGKTHLSNIWIAHNSGQIISKNRYDLFSHKGKRKMLSS